MNRYVELRDLCCKGTIWLLSVLSGRRVRKESAQHLLGKYFKISRQDRKKKYQMEEIRGDDLKLDNFSGLVTGRMI